MNKSTNFFCFLQENCSIVTFTNQLWYFDTIVVLQVFLTERKLCKDISHMEEMFK